MTDKQKELLSACPDGWFGTRDIPKNLINTLSCISPRHGWFDKTISNDPQLYNKKAAYRLTEKGRKAKKKLW